MNTSFSEILYPNVDYYSAIVLYTLDLDVDMFTPLFAMSRIAGWSAHVIAQMGGRLIRPKAELCWSARLQVGTDRRTLTRPIFRFRHLQTPIVPYAGHRFPYESRLVEDNLPSAYIVC